MSAIVRDIDKISGAQTPNEIFSMRKDELDDEYAAYSELLKPVPYHAVEYFVALQNVTLLYQEACKILESMASSGIDNGCGDIGFTSKAGARHDYSYLYHSNFRAGDMYSCRECVVYVVKDKKMYFNYLDKVNVFSNSDVWNNSEIAEKAKYIFPKVIDNYETDSGEYVIVVEKPYTAFPLRQICEYLGSNLLPEHIASIATRLYFFVSLINIENVDIHHNAIYLDNIFFAPGKNTDGKTEPFTLEDCRFAGVYGGWFFSTYGGEYITILPVELKDLVTSEMLNTRRSSFVFDALSIKKLIKELFDYSGVEMPGTLEDWTRDMVYASNAYLEFMDWERVKKNSFGIDKFVEMNL